MSVDSSADVALTRRVVYRIVCPLSDEETRVTYEPETHDTFATVTFDSCVVQVAELDRLIDRFNQIRDDIKKFISEDTSKP